MNKLKAGLIGGFFGHIIYAEELFSHALIEPVGIAGIPYKRFSSEKIYKELSKKYKVPFYSDYRDFLKEKKPDICIVMTPPEISPKIVKELAERKINILSEKPIAGSFKGAKIISESVRKNKVIYSACFPLSKFAQSFKITKSSIEKGKLGKPLVANFTYLATRGPLYITKTPYYKDEKIRGGEVSMFSGYGVIALEWFTSQRIKEIYARAGTYFYPEYKKMKIEDIGFILIEFDKGCTGSLLLGRVPAKSEPVRIEVDLTGTKGNIKIRSSSDTVVLYQDYINKRKLEADRGGVKKYEVGLPVSSVFIDDFVKSVAENRKPAISLQECLNTISVLDAIYKSVLTDKKQKVIEI